MNEPFVEIIHFSFGKYTKLFAFTQILMIVFHGEY